LPTWDAFTEAGTEFNNLETLGISGAAGVPEPKRPQELGRGFAVASQGAPGGEG
jgi:hypothetical protein